MKALFHTPAAIVGGGETQFKYLIESLPTEVECHITYDKPALSKFVSSISCSSQLAISPNQLYLALHTFRPDIAIFYHSPTFVKTLRRAPKFCKVVEIVHNRHPFTGDAMSYTKSLNDVTVCVSPDVETYCLSIAPDTHTKVIPNGIDPVFKPGPPKPIRARPLGGFAGRLEKDPWKGIGRLLSTIAELPVDFELVGEDFGGYAQRLPKNVKWLPFTTNIVQHYHNWDFFVSASISEGFGLSIAEALACGLPSVIYNCGGICHYLENGKHALIVDNYAQMGEAIMALPQAKLQPTSIDFSARKMASAYFALFQDLLGEPTGIKVNAGSIERLAVVPKGWYGVRRALKPLTECEVDPTTHEAVRQIRARKPRLLVLGCYFPAWRPVLEEARRIGAKVICTWHASFILNEFDKINRDGMAAMLQAYQQGLIHRLATPHHSLAKVFTSLGYETDFLPNIVDELDPVEPLPGINIGLFGTGASWKNMECQLVAASLIPDAKIHVQQLQHTSVIKELGLMNRLVQHPNYIRSDEEYYKLIGGMTVNMVVSLSEVYSYYIAESMMMGVPVVATAITPLLKGAAWLEQTCTTPYFEDPVEIANTLARVIRDRDTVRIKSMTHIRELNKQSKLLVEEVTKTWHKL